MSDYLESTATPEELEAHIDIADRLTAQLRDGSLKVACPSQEFAQTEGKTQDADGQEQRDGI